MWFIIGFSFILFLGAIAQLTNDEPRVTIAQGVVIGSRATDGEYFEFHGIPYADSTSGLNRFKAPMPPPSFEDVFVANRKDVKCVRALGVGFEGTEDCLVANIFTPSLDVTNGLPVMVWIKGKEFDQVYEPELLFRNFMEKEVVVISLNYRESILGFLCLGTTVAPGNAGLKDIVAGLKWVRENAAQFGGDPNNISLFGHGSGAAAVDLVSLSPMSNGLIHKVITQSGTALSPWAVSRDNIKYAVDVAEALGHKITDIDELSEVFTRISVTALMAVINELDLTDNSLAFAPCLEKPNLDGIEPLLLKSPYEVLTSDEFVSVPFMAGFVDKEGTIRSEEALENDWIKKMSDSFIDFIQPDLSFENSDIALEVADEIKYFYFENQDIDMNTIDEYLLYHGDTMILVSTLREVRMRALASSDNVYLYQFSYKGSLGGIFEGPLPINKAAHSEELAYLFRDFNFPANERDLIMSDILIERWTNFAKTGVPTSESSQVQWHPYTRDNSYCLQFLDNDVVNSEIGGTLEVELENPHPDTINFWENIYGQYFLDATSRWEIVDRVEEEGSGEEGGDDDEGSGGNEENEEEEENDDDDDDDDDGNENNSATTTIGYTFLIISIYAVLEKLHMSQLIS